MSSYEAMGDDSVHHQNMITQIMINVSKILRSHNVSIPSLMSFAIWTMKNSFRPKTLENCLLCCMGGNGLAGTLLPTNMDHMAAISGLTV